MADALQRADSAAKRSLWKKGTNVETRGDDRRPLLQ